MKHFILGTAGHVDHGKTALIEVLTGTNTDRLKEEKTRGISIDLGFAALPLSSHYTASVVDVPGHEKYLKNMLAGTGGLDAVLLVIAADEGVMPQTREHLDMVERYGVKQGLVALTKCDLVDSEWLDFVRDEVKNFLQDTVLAQAPLIAVSSVTSQGIPELRQELLKLARQISYRKITGPFRLCIDRVFTIKGHGTVVTGSVLSGCLPVGAKLWLMPEQREVRIRNLECHGISQQEVVGGQRAALNLAGEEKLSVRRGMWLVTPGYGQVAQQWAALADWKKPIEAGTLVHVYAGTGEYAAKVYYFKQEGQTYLRLRFDQAQAFLCGDRALLRLKSPPQLAGAVTLVQPWGHEKRISPEGKQLLQFAHNRTNWDSSEWVAYILADAKGPLAFAEILGRTRLMEPGKLKMRLQGLVEQNQIFEFNGYYAQNNWLRQVWEQLKQLLEQGRMNREILRCQAGLDRKTFDWLIEYGEKNKAWISDGSELVLPDHHEAYCRERDQKICNFKQELAQVNELELPKAWFTPERLAGLTLEELVQGNVLVKYQERLFPAERIRIIVLKLQAYFQDHLTLKAAEFRDLIGSTRKIAIPLLEYLDQQKVTVRKGDDRFAGPKLYRK